MLSYCVDIDLRILDFSYEYYISMIFTSMSNQSFQNFLLFYCWLTLIVHSLLWHAMKSRMNKFWMRVILHFLQKNMLSLKKRYKNSKSNKNLCLQIVRNNIQYKHNAYCCIAWMYLITHLISGNKTCERYQNRVKFSCSWNICCWTIEDVKLTLCIWKKDLLISNQYLLSKRKSI